MHARRSPRCLLLAVLALTLACGDRPGPTGIVESAPWASAKGRFDPESPLAVKTAVRVEELDGETIRERVELVVFFTGIDPIDPTQQVPRPKHLELDLEVELAGAVGPPCIRFIVPSESWAAAGGRFLIEDSDPTSLPAVQAVKVQDGQVVADLTKEIEAVEAKLEFVQDAKGWLLELELTGIPSPSAIVGPMYSPIVGAIAAALRVGEDEVMAEVSGGEARYRGSSLEVKVAAQVEGPDGQTIREHVESAYFFTGVDLIDLSQQAPQVKDLQIEFDLAVAGGAGVTRVIRAIPGAAWTAVDGGTRFRFEASGHEEVSAAIQIHVVQDGQVVADLTKEIESVEAKLEFVEAHKAWLLTVELIGIAFPASIVPPLFHPMLGAVEVSLQAGQDEVSTVFGAGEAAFF